MDLNTEIIKLVELATKTKEGNKSFLNLKRLTKKEVLLFHRIDENLLWHVLKDKEYREYFHSIDLSGIRHVFNRHPNISIGDFLLIPEILKNYDSIEKGNNPGTVVYTKKIADTYFYVEEIRKGRKKLVIKTFYKKKARNKSELNR